QSHHSQQSPMQAMHTVMQPSPPSSSQSLPQVWLTDSGATNHMTADLSTLSLATPYPTNETVQTANGEGLSDKATGRILYKGLCSNGLYPIPLASSHSVLPTTKPQPRAYLGQLVFSSTWHHRLGHPTNKLVTLMLQKAHVQCNPASSAVMCHSCLQGKFCKLPFSHSVHRHVIFDEHAFPYADLVTHSKVFIPSPTLPSASSPSPVVTNNNIVVLPTSPATTFSDTFISPSNTPASSSSSSPLFITGAFPSFSSIPVVPESNAEALSTGPLPLVASFQPDSMPVVLEGPPMNLHPMQTRSKSGIVKKKVFLTTLQESGGVDLSLVEPATYKTALKVPVWLTAMKEEIDALHSQGTWSLVPLPHNKNLVGCKWVFKIKKHADGSIARHK
ncbi:PREDICTED: Retrovirus-related Pol poly from transposon, partial [Prunus dulcis]